MGKMLVKVPFGAHPGQMIQMQTPDGFPGFLDFAGLQIWKHTHGFCGVKKKPHGSCGKTCACRFLCLFLGQCQKNGPFFF